MQKTKSIQQSSLLEIVDFPIGEEMDYLDTLEAVQRETTGHTIKQEVFV